MFEVDEFDLFYDDDEQQTLDGVSAVSSDELLVACLNRLGRVDIKEMSNSSGRPAADIVGDLMGGAIFQDPALFEDAEHWDIEYGWLTAAQYCTGNLRKKLEIAQRVNKKFPGVFDSNIVALKKMLPCDLTMTDIRITPGAPWVPPEVYGEFLKDLLGFSKAPEVIFNRQSATWKIIVPEEAHMSVSNNMTYGTDTMSAIKIFEHTMNARTVKHYDYIPTRGWNYERVFNRAETLAAQEKQKLILNRFELWQSADKDRAAFLEDCYNQSFVGYGVSPYDGSFLKFPDLNPEVSFYLHQRNAIARMLLSPDNLLLAHDVGTGKTYEICAGVHEMYRMGISKKNLVVVPNNVLKATVDAHRYLYPNDNILVIYPKDFTPNKRKAALEKVRDGDYVAVYMAYSSFDMVVMSKRYNVDKMQAQIDELKNALTNDLHPAERKMIKRQREALSKKLSKYVLETSDTPWLTFDKLGIETLFLDECHFYKNIPLDSRADNIVGMHSSGSKKCAEMLDKTRCVKKVVFATGTPLTNSLADLFVLQTYLQPDELKFRGIQSFDMWINVFGVRETAYEVDVDSKNLRAITRFSRFHNLMELMALFSTVCDFHHVGENAAELPAFNGYTDVMVPRSAAQGEFINNLSRRTDLIRAHKVKRTEDNLLLITIDGRKCALDLRLVDPNAVIDGVTKIGVCAAQVYRIYKQSDDSCQIVFSDIGTPKAGFNVYDCLKDELVALGIPAEQIAFVHDATSETARAKLFRAMNEGRVRVVIGSTEKLGVGVNVQEKLVALHHLSVPWKPSDMVQREGRALRHGNTSDEVFIFRYITEGSFDSFSWQIMENKQRFISSFLSGTAAQRDADDVADAILNYAEVKALAIGNPLIKKRVETANLLERAKMSCRARQNQLISLRAVVDSAPDQIKKLKKNLATVVADKELYKESREVVPQSERIAFGEELLEAITSNVMCESERLFDRYQGFDIFLPAAMQRDEPYIYIRSKNGGDYRVDMDTDKPLGCAMRVDHLLEHLGERADRIGFNIGLTEKNRREAIADIDSGNEYTAQIESLETLLADIDRELAGTGDIA